MAVERASLDAVFGRDNISLWADLNNNSNPTDIAARTSWAITLATAFVKAKCTPLSYTWDNISTHALIEHAIVLRAGLLLYANRAVADTGENGKNPMSVHETAFNKFFKELSAGQVALDEERTCRPYPAVIL